MPKNWKGDPLGFLNTQSVVKYQRNWRGPFGEKISEKKSRSAEKNWKGAPFGLARYGMLRGKTGRTFLVQFARPNGAMIFCRTFNNYFGQFVWIEKKTSRDRPKSAPYPRLKNSKKDFQVSSTLLQYSKIEIFWKKFFRKNYILKKNGPSGAPGLASASLWRAKVSQCRKTERVDPLRFFNIHSVAKHEKIEENKNFHFREKISQCQKKTERGTLWDFFASILSQNIKKNAGGTLWGKFF